MIRTAAIIASGGVGKRFSSSSKKQFCKINGKPLLYWSILPFQKSPFINRIVIVVTGEDMAYVRKAIVEKYKLTKVDCLIEGGRERQDSIFNGLRFMGEKPDYVFIHDGVRPFVKLKEIREALKAVRKGKGVIFATRARNTIKRVKANGSIIETIPRGELWEAHTPQVFDYDMILGAYKKAYRKKIYSTDDASLVEAIGKSVNVFPCSNENMKVTYRSDLKSASKILKAWRY
jgi:2-C-methyl-D-erythritol 4-phosphate cytidylyltransferase